jgi:hypothetical protein
MKNNLTEKTLRPPSQKERRYTADAAVESQLLKKTLRPAALLTFGILGWLEKKLWPEAKLRYSPVFIVAPPRSGTTLLYQLMTGYMSTCYFTNLAQRLRVQGGEIIPALSAHLIKLLKLDQRQNGLFESYYGATEGWGGPNEANGIWERWFPEEEHYVPPGYLSASDRQGVYQAVAVTERVFDRPFVNKCIRNSVRVQALAEIFPTALFIQCTREPLAMAQSIFIARTHVLPFKLQEVEDPSKWWWSVKPKEYETIKSKGMIEQVCEQVFYVEQSIIAARHVLGEDRFLLVDYKDLCQAPRHTLDRIVRFMNDHGAPTRVTQPIPDSFPHSTGRKIDRADYLALADYLCQLYGQPMEVSDD